MNLLPATPGVKESFTSQFLKQLKLKALALAKYVDAEPLVYIIIYYCCLLQFLASCVYSRGEGGTRSPTHWLWSAITLQNGTFGRYLISKLVF